MAWVEACFDVYTNIDCGFDSDGCPGGGETGGQFCPLASAAAETPFSQKGRWPACSRVARQDFSEAKIGFSSKSLIGMSFSGWA